MPKSYQQAKAEVDITKQFLYNFSGDQVRFLAKGFTTPGDHQKQQSTGYRWPYGPVALITPFIFSKIWNYSFNRSKIPILLFCFYIYYMKEIYDLYDETKKKSENE